MNFIIIRYLLVLISVSFVSLGFTQTTTRIIPESADTISNPYSGDIKIVKEGATIYKLVCWTCHGDRGNGKGPQAEEIETKPVNFNDPQVVERTDGALFWWITHGGEDMEAFENSLTIEERWAIVNYIRRLQKK